TELQGASASRGDLYAISAESLAVRSFRSTGAVCGTSTKRYGVAQAAGSFGSTADDSALITKTSGSTWNPVKVDVVWTNPGSPYVATCPSWSGTPVPPTVIEVHVGTAADTAGLGVGSVVRGFQKTVYKLAQVNGRWWLTRRVGSAGTYDIVTGPLRSDVDRDSSLQLQEGARSFYAADAGLNQILAQWADSAYETRVAAAGDSYTFAWRTLPENGSSYRAVLQRLATSGAISMTVDGRSA